LTGVSESAILESLINNQTNMRQSLFNDPTKVIANSPSNSIDWNPETIGDTIDGTFIGQRIIKDVPSKFGADKRDVAVLDFTEVALNEVPDADQSAVHTVWMNPFLKVVWEKQGFQPGQLAAIRFTGKSPEFNNSKNFIVAGVPGDHSKTWKPGQAPVHAAPVVAAPVQHIQANPVPTATLPSTESQFGKSAEVPFGLSPAELDKKIAELLAGKLYATEKTYQGMAKNLSKLEYTEANVEKIYDILSKQFTN